MKTKLLPILVTLLMLITGINMVSAQGPCGVPGQFIGCCPCTGCAPITQLPFICVQQAGTIVVPITNSGVNFADIAAISLKFDFDPTVLQFAGVITAPNLPSGFPAPMVGQPNGPGSVTISWTYPAFTLGSGWFLNDGQVIFNLTFNFLPPGGGVTALNWDVYQSAYSNAAQVLAFGSDILCQAAANYVNGRASLLNAWVNPPYTTCQYAPLQLIGQHNTTAFPYTYKWSGPGAVYLNSTTISNPYFTSPNAGEYLLYFKVKDGFGCVDSVPVTIVVKPNPTCTITGPAPVCGLTTNTYSSGVLPDGGTVTHSWTITGDGTIVGASDGSTVTVLAGVGDGSFTITDAVNRDGCAGWCSKTVVVNKNPTCTIDGPSAVCGLSYNNHTSTVLPAGGTVVHSWTITGNGTINGATNLATVNVHAGLSGSYTVTDNLTRNGCAGTCSKTVIVNPNPICAIEGPGDVCERTTNLYTSVVNPLDGTVTHSWSITGNGTISGPTNLATVNVIAGDDGLYILTDNIVRNGCPGFCIRTVLVKETPTATISGPDPVCGGTINEYDIFVLPLLGTETHYWTITGDGVMLGNGNEIVWFWTEPIVRVRAGASGTFTITDNFTREGCPGVKSKTVIVNPMPTCSIAGPLAVCGATTNTYTSTVLPSGGVVTHHWTLTGNGTISGGHTSATLIVIAGASGTYTVQDDIVRNDCPSSCSVIVTVNPNPTCTIDGPDAVCGNSTNTHANVVLPAGGIVTHSWSITGNGTIQGATNTASVTVLAGATGQYIVTDAITRNNCPGTCNKTVIVKPIPTCQITGPDPVCGGTTNVYSGAILPVGYTTGTYSWSITGNGSISGATNASTVNVVAGVSGSYTLCLLVTRDGCTAVQTCCKTVTVNPIPTCSIAGPNPVCYSLQGNYTYTSTVLPALGTVTHAWTITGAATIVGSTTDASVMIHTTTNAEGTFTLCDNIVRNGCASSCCITVVVNPNPTCTIDGPDAVCALSTGNVYANVVLPAGGIVTHSWSITGNGTITSGLTGSSVTVTATAAGTYTVTDAITRNGCPGSCSKTVTVNPIPTCSIAGDANVCGGSAGSYTSTVLPAGGTVTHLWSITGNGTINGANNTATVDIIAGLVDGPFTLTDNITRNGCASSCTKTVQVSAIPTCSIDGPISVCQGSTNTHTSTVLPAGGTVTHHWNVTGHGIIIGSHTLATVTILAGSEDSYTVTDEIYRNNCYGICSKTVIVHPLPILECATLQFMVGTGPWIEMNGLCMNYNMCLDPAVPSYYLDINTLTATQPLMDNFLNPFKLTNVPNAAAYFAYWAARGVVAGATGWQGQMWLIINGNAPFFYVKKVGTDYKLVDGLQYWVAGNTGEPMLTVPGDYPPDNYTFTGSIKDIYNCTSLDIPIHITFNRNPSCLITGESYVCPGALNNVYTGPSGLNYLWTISGNGTIIGSAIQQTVNVTALGAGTFTLCLKTTDPQTGCFSNCCKTVTVVFRNLSGTITYPNCYTTTMSNVGVGLVPVPGTVPIQTATTNASGQYSFTNLCAGDYTVIVTQNNKPVGGINSTDAAQVLIWPTILFPIQHSRFLQGDVTNDNLLTGFDALRIQQFFVSGTPFTRAPWSYWKKGDMLNTQIPAPPLTWFVKLLASADLVNIDLLAGVTGDFNESYIPGSAKAETENLEITYGSTRNVGAGQEFELPVYATTAMGLSAVSLVLNVPSDLVEVKDVTVTGSNSPVSYSVNDNVLKISWYSETSMQVAETDAVVILKLKTTSAFVEGSTFRLTLAGDPLNELADADAMVIPHAQLGVEVIANSPVGIIDPNGKDFSLNCHPNPFKDYSTISYTLPESGEVTLEIMNMVGQVIATYVNEPQASGKHNVKLASTQMPSGIYMAVLKFKNGTDELLRTIKIVVNK